MITTRTEQFALIGDQVYHSKSPDIMNAAFSHMQIDCIYTAYNVSLKNLREAVTALKVLGFRGWNVTLPHKVEIIKYLDLVDQTAQEIGAVNTVVNDDGKLIGYNTDGIGYLRSLKEEVNINISSQHVVILGAGGAARSIGFVLAKEGVQSLSIATRTMAKAEALAEKLSLYTKAKAISLVDLEAELKKTTLFIHATSIGMHPQVRESPVASKWLHSDLIVSDLVYNPKHTTLIKAAKEKGATIHYGLGMLVYQAANAIELWTERKPPVHIMREKLEESGLS